MHELHTVASGFQPWMFANWSILKSHWYKSFPFPEGSNGGTTFALKFMLIDNGGECPTDKYKFALVLNAVATTHLMNSALIDTGSSLSLKLIIGRQCEFSWMEWS